MKKWWIIILLLVCAGCKLTQELPEGVPIKIDTRVYTIEQLSAKADSLQTVINEALTTLADIVKHYVALDKNFYVDSQQVMRFKSFVAFDSVWVKSINVGPNPPTGHTNPHDGNDTLKHEGMQIDSLQIKVEK